MNGPDDLRKALLARPEQFVQTLTEKLMTYALGRSVEYYDMPAVRAHRARRRARRLPVLVDRHGHRAERAVPIQHDRRPADDAGTRDRRRPRQD